MSLRLLVAACLLAIPALSLAAERPTPRHARGSPNVLFLFTDDQRPDTIAALGNGHIKTPHLDKLVARGLSFTNAYIMGGTSLAVCTPSRACLFSGRTLWNLENQDMWNFELAEDHKTMTQVFLENGYTAFATGKHDPGFGRNGHFARSFNAGDNLYYRGGHRGQNRTPLFSVTFENGGVTKTKKPADGTFNAELFADACVEFLEGRKGNKQPFFAYVSFMTPHDPFNAPGEYLEMYRAEDMVLPENFLPEHPFNAGVHHIRDEKLMQRPLRGEKLRAQLARYYALVTHTDAQVGRILDALEESGHADHTIIVFTSDNGLALGSHGLTGKQNVYEHSVKIPFLLSGPGIPAGEKRGQLTYLYDIYPTLCEMTGIPVPETVQFQSFKPLLNDAKAEHRQHLSFAFLQWHRAVRDERYKLIEYCVDGERHTQLFDLIADPHETRNLAQEDAHAGTLARLRKLLQDERRRLNDGETPSPFTTQLGKDFWTTCEGAH
ncbi:MAG: sulfatase-like hydrolase/transferase [Akkermansiaceae bacterium]|nr:sulfatase-like hydrolase/transferase [Akkermansiaceae bacterium]